MYKIGDQIERNRVVDKMKKDEELEKMLSGIHHHQVPYVKTGHKHPPLVSGSGSPFSGVVQLSTDHPSAPASSFYPNGFYLAEENFSQFSTVNFPSDIADVNKFKTPNVTDDHVSGLWLDSHSNESCRFRKNVVPERLDYDELGLCESLYRMSVGKEQKDHCIIMNRHEMNPQEVSFGFGHGYVGLPYTVEKYGISDGLNNTDYQGVDTSPGVVSRSLDDQMKSVSIALGGRRGEGGLKNGIFFHSQANDMPQAPCYGIIRNCVFEQRKEQERSWSNGGLQSQRFIASRPYIKDALFGSQRHGLDTMGETGFMNQLISTPLMYHDLGLDLETQLCNCSLLKERTSVMPNNRDSVSHVPLNEAGVVDGFGVEDSFIIQGKSLNHIVNKAPGSLGGHKKNTLNEVATKNPPEKISKLESCAQNGRLCDSGQNISSYFPLHLLPSSSSLAEFRGYIYLMAKDQNGCRFLQRVFDEGTYQDVQIIFNEVIDHVVELMMEQFGNYLVQKLLNVCNEEHRTQIVLMVSKEPGQLVRICLNTYGTRVVQKLIETLKTRQQVSAVKAALRPGFLNLIKDLNGNHVLQRCLQCLSNEDNEFIFDSAARFCVEIATHQHGCCVLQRCIAHSIGELRDKLITEISNHGLLLAQDPFGNYVVQYIIELKIPSVAANFLAQFKGRYVHLSKQKFSSHVVEKCLKHFGESRSQIVHELLSVPHFEQLLQDPFANYVIQSALTVTKGPLHAALLEAARPHSFLRTSPYCKRIFSRNLSKK